MQDNSLRVALEPSFGNVVAMLSYAELVRTQGNRHPVGRRYTKESSVRPCSSEVLRFSIKIQTFPHYEDVNVQNATVHANVLYCGHS